MKVTSGSTALYSQDVAGLLYKNSFGGIFISFIASSALVVSFANGENADKKTLWLVAMSLCLLVRLGDASFWRATLNGTDYDGEKAIKRFVSGCIVTALMWAIYIIAFSQDMAMAEYTSTVVIIAAMAGGASTVLAAHRATAIAYALILLLPTSACAMFSEQEHQHVLGYLGIAFALIMVAAAYKSSEFTQQAIHLKNDNADLLAQMAIEKQAVKDANASLEQKVKLRTQEIYELSYIDPLTGLSNRKAFSYQLATLLEESEQHHQTLALLFIDLDGFKAINDSRGHKTGDLVLQETAKRIESLAQNHRNICRWGGDEFLLAAANVDQENALALARNIIDSLSCPIDTQYDTLSLGATIGIALYPHHGNNEDQLIRLADSAMYLQKKSANSEARVFSQHMMDTLERQQYLRDGLAQAVAKRQLYLTYQPILDTNTHEVVSFEALLRWQFEDELIPPDEFIAIAERFGSIKEIGCWVLEQACQDACLWSKENNISVSVNVSVVQLLGGKFYEQVKHAISMSGLAPERLSVEVTESTFAEDQHPLRTFVNEVRSLGVKVSIDDFGTGYSSLSLLQTLPVNIVKIDQAFVSKMDRGGKAVIHAALHIAQSLHYQVVAEGVETAQQAQQLQDMGVQYLQGYYFAKPMRYEKAIDWLKQVEKSESPAKRA